MSSPREDKIRRIADAILDKKGEDVVALDVHEVSSFTDGFVLATGNSDRHVRTIAEAVIVCAKQELGEKPLGIEGLDEGRWVLIDLGDIVVHLFQHEVRDHYDLERLWSDGARLPLGDDDARSAAP